MPQVVSHDGHWRVELVTTVGNCQKSGLAVLTVKNNKIAAIDEFGHRALGLY